MTSPTNPRGLPTENSAEAFGVTPVNKVKRLHERGRYDRKTVYEILDAALVCHIAYVIDGRPYCTPTAFWNISESGNRVAGEHHPLEAPTPSPAHRSSRQRSSLRRHGDRQ